LVGAEFVIASLKFLDGGISFRGDFLELVTFMLQQFVLVCQSGDLSPLRSNGLVRIS